jgi:hypothetical protein
MGNRGDVRFLPSMPEYIILSPPTKRLFVEMNLAALAMIKHWRIFLDTSHSYLVISIKLDADRESCSIDVEFTGPTRTFDGVDRERAVQQVQDQLSEFMVEAGARPKESKWVSSDGQSMCKVIKRALGLKA